QAERDESGRCTGRDEGDRTQRAAEAERCRRQAEDASADDQVQTDCDQIPSSNGANQAGLVFRAGRRRGRHASRTGHYSFALRLRSSSTVPFVRFASALYSLKVASPEPFAGGSGASVAANGVCPLLLTTLIGAPASTRN